MTSNSTVLFIWHCCQWELCKNLKLLTFQGYVLTSKHLGKKLSSLSTPAIMGKGVKLLPFLLPFINYFPIMNCEYEFVIVRMDFWSEQYSFSYPFHFFPEDASAILRCSKKSLAGQDLIFINFSAYRPWAKQKPATYNPPSLLQQQNTDEDRTSLSSSGEEVGAKTGWFCYCCYCCCCSFVLFSFFHVCIEWCVHAWFCICVGTCVESSSIALSPYSLKQGLAGQTRAWYVARTAGRLTLVPNSDLWGWNHRQAANYLGFRRSEFWSWHLQGKHFNP